MCSLLGHCLFQQDSSCSGSPKASSSPLVILQSLKKKKISLGNVPFPVHSNLFATSTLLSEGLIFLGFPDLGLSLQWTVLWGGAFLLAIGPSKLCWVAAALKTARGKKMERRQPSLLLSLALWLSSAMILQAWNLRNFLPRAPWKS